MSDGQQESGSEAARAVLTRRALIGAGVVAGAALAVTPWWSRDDGPRRPAGGAGDSARAPAPPGASHPSVVRRAQWGADEVRRSGRIDFDATVEKIVLHHTGTDNGVGDWADQVRRIYEYESSGGYRDIAYHFLVDPNGVIYEGRWARAYPADVEPDATDEEGRLVRGGHARRHNPRTIGIALLGDYTTAQPTDAAVTAILGLLVWHCRRWGVDPLGSGPYTDTTGAVAEFPHVVAHGQIRATQCPGANLDRLLPDLRTRTAAALAREMPADAPTGDA